MRIIVLAPPTFSALNRLREAQNIEAVTVDDAQSLSREVRDADVLLLAPRYGSMLRDVLPNATKLRWIHSLGAGVETLPFDVLSTTTINVTNSRGIYADALAEFAVGAMIWFAKDFRRLAANQVVRKWEPFTVERLEGKTVGIVGLGAIGRAIARRAEAFGMHILGTRRSGGTPLDDLIAGAHFVVLSAPLTNVTRGLMNGARIHAMRRDAVLINISRGAIVDESALLSALQSRRIRGAALDVFETEPLPADHALWALDNVLISPHSASTLADENRRIVDLFLANLERFLAGRPLLNRFDPARGY